MHPSRALSAWEVISRPCLFHHANTAFTQAVRVLSLSVFGLYIKARTRFVGELSVAVHGRLGELTQQLRHQLLHRYPLQYRASVVWLALLIQSALVTDADRVCVLSLAVCALLSQRSPCVDRATAVNKEVIADSLEPSLLVPAGDCLHIHSLPWQGRAAMEDDLVNASHTIVGWLGISCAVICIWLLCLLPFSDWMLYHLPSYWMRHQRSIWSV